MFKFNNSQPDFFFFVQNWRLTYQNNRRRYGSFLLLYSVPNHLWWTWARLGYFGIKINVLEGVLNVCEVNNKDTSSNNSISPEKKN